MLGDVADDVFDAPVSPLRAAAFLAAPGHALFVALAGGVVVGQVRGMVHVQPDEPSQLYIDNLGVAPAHQRRGVATALVKALVAWGREQACASVWVAAESSDETAGAFYASLGFEPKTLEWFSSDFD